MTFIARDLHCIWHPCTQMKDYLSFPPIEIKKAYGSYLETKEGKILIDAISSWWCKSLGHGHPRLKKALLEQTKYFEHVILANTCQPVLVELSEKLLNLCSLDKIFYTSEGSSAVEIAIKMSLHSRKITGELKRNRIMALQNGYHGETLLALSCSDLGLYREPYQDWLLPTLFLHNIPYVFSKEDPLWEDCSPNWPMIETQLNRYASELSAIIVEPIVQGSSGMLVYSQDFLKRLRNWTHQQGIHLIADEIMTGLGRTGYPLACQHAHIKPDFVVLGKGLTGGFIPMSAILTTEALYQLFYGDYEKKVAFLHSHTFGGNALAAAVALESLKILEEENRYEQVRKREGLLRQLMLEVADTTGYLTQIRGIGAIVAADLILKKSEKDKRMGYKVFQNAVNLGALLRPLGNTLYWLLPLNVETKTLFELRNITIQAINQTFS